MSETLDEIRPLISKLRDTGSGEQILKWLAEHFADLSEFEHDDAELFSAACDLALEEFRDQTEGTEEK